MKIDSNIIQRVKRQIRLFSLFLFITYPSFATSLVTFPKVTIVTNNTSWNVQYANTPERHQQGLMFRDNLCEHCGMLFDFKQEGVRTFWMKNTPIDLDIAFINAKGTITSIKPLTAYDEVLVFSNRPVRYAWEMHRGWFSRQGLSVGSNITLHHP